MNVFSWTMLTLMVAGPAGAGGPSDATPRASEQRIAVENGLRPLVRVRGQKNASAKLTDRLKQLDVAGLSIAVFDDNAFAWSSGYGLADVPTRAAMTNQTLLHASGAGAPVAAFVTLRRAKAHGLDLDADVNERLKRWKVAATVGPPPTHVSARTLLNHTAGVNVERFEGYRSAPRRPAKLPSLLETLNGLPPSNNPPIRAEARRSGGYGVSQGGLVVLQAWLEDSTGHSFAELAQEDIFAPLGLAQSTFACPLPKSVAAMAAAGHDADGTSLGPQARLYPESAAAGLWTTPRELGEVMLEVPLARRERSRLGLGPDELAAILDRPKGAPTGLGVRVAGVGPGLRVEATGRSAGFRTLAVFFVESGKGAVIMANSDRAEPLIVEALRAIATVYAWPTYGPGDE